MRFEHPHNLWLLLVLPPAMLAFFWWAMRERRRLVTQFIEARLLPALTVGLSVTRQKFRMACLIGAVALLLVVLARLQWGFHWEETKMRGLDIVVAIDTSKSMLAEDVTPNRLTRAKLAALDLMQQARSDRLGLVAFAGGAFLQCPLTADDTAFRQSVEALDVNVISQGGTALAGAIGTALTAFKEGENYKVLVLFTDGEDNDDGALEAAQSAAKQGLRIFTVGIGTAEGELLRAPNTEGVVDYVRDEQGAVIKSHLNETLLQQIAGATEGGFYLPLRGAKTVDTLYERGLAPLPKAEQSAKLVKRYHERYHWPLAAAILLLLVEMFLPERRRANGAGTGGLTGSTPQRALQSAGVETGVTSRAGVLAALLVLLLPGVALGSPAGALRQYHAGKFTDSQCEYERLVAQDKTHDARLEFNAGTAAYRAQKFNEAAGHLSKALSAREVKLQQQAYYNLGNALYRLGENAAEPGQKIDVWENALKSFGGACKLNPQDRDAKFNYEYVKKKLEELKQQQQQQQQKDQKQDQQDKQDQQKKEDQQNQQQQSKSDQQKQQADKKEQQQQQQQQSQQQQAQNQKREQDKQEQQQKQQQAKSDDKKEKKGEPQKTYAVGQMTPAQAQQLLDAQKGEESLLLFKADSGKPENPERKIKDW